MSSKQKPHITTTKTPGGWKREMDNNTWLLLMSVLMRAISSDLRDGNEAEADTFRTLRSAMSRADHSESF